MAFTALGETHRGRAYNLVINAGSKKQQNIVPNHAYS